MAVLTPAFLPAVVVVPIPTEVPLRNDPSVGLPAVAVITPDTLSCYKNVCALISTVPVTNKPPKVDIPDGALTLPVTPPV